MVSPEPPEFLRPYQPHLRYYLVDEGAYSEAELHRRQTALSGVFEIEQASSREALQSAVSQIVRVIESDPRKQRLDKVITRWLKRHLSRMGADVNLDRMNSLVEDRGMLAENLRHWAEKERTQGREEGVQKGLQEGLQKGLQEGRLEVRREMARTLIVKTELDDQMMAEIAGLTVEQVAELRAEASH